MSEPKDLFMLCESIPTNDETLLASYSSKPNYKANEKMDGERVMCVKKADKVMLFNRRGNIITHKFNEVVKEIKTFEGDFMIDGEVIAMDETFNSTQRRALTKDIKKIAELEKTIPVKYMVFDILSFNGQDIRAKPLQERLKVLTEKLLSKQQELNHIFICDYDDINNTLQMVIEKQGEGIVIKDMNGTYESKRSKNWLKYKLFKETTLTITGFTDNPKGIRATDNLGNAVQISGYHTSEVKAELQSKGYAEINIQYLTKSSEGRYRFPSYRGLA